MYFGRSQIGADNRETTCIIQKLFLKFTSILELQMHSKVT